MVNTAKLKRMFIGNAGAFMWAFVPTLGLTTNYAATALDELSLLLVGTVGMSIAEERRNSRVLSPFLKGLSAGAMGLLSWNLTSSAVYPLVSSKQVAR